MADRRTNEVIDEESSTYDKTSWKPFLRQLLVCSGVWTSYFMYGLVVGAPTVFIPQIRTEANSTQVVDADMASWLTSVVGFSAFPWIFVISILAQRVGRKMSHMVACVDTFIAFLVFFCSANVPQILISEIIQGFFSASQVIISVMVLTEYISPRYRGLFLTIKSATFYWGIWTANAIGTFFHWKKIGLVGILCAVYSLATTIIWPESPYWLASKEKYMECAASHRWLKGCDDDSERELKALIDTQKEYLKSHLSVKESKARMLNNFYEAATAREFYKPTLISILTGFLSIASGKLVCAVYAIDILKKITGNVSTAYTGMLILDGVTVASMYVGCIVSKFVKRRTMLLVASSIGVLFLFILSLYLYLIHLSLLTENNYASVCLLVSFSVAISCGPLIMSTTVYGELIPLRCRTLAFCITAIIAKLCFGITMKSAPYIFSAFGLHGTFLVFGISSTIVIILLYKYLPETKDKTLQQITDSILGVTQRNSLYEEASKLVEIR